MRNTFRIILLGISSAFNALVYQFLIDQKVNSFISLFLGTCAAIFLFHLVDFILHRFPLRYLAFRKLFVLHSKMEGVFVEYFVETPSVPRAVFVIYYNRHQDAYCFEGFYFSEDVCAKWEDDYFRFDSRSNKATFFVLGKYGDGRKDTMVTGQLTFDSDQNGGFQHGTGSFYDPIHFSHPQMFHFSRLTTYKQSLLCQYQSLPPFEDCKKIIKENRDGRQGA